MCGRTVRPPRGARVRLGLQGGDGRPTGSGAVDGWAFSPHPGDAQTADGTTFLRCDVAEALRIALEAAGGKSVEVHWASIGRQLLERGLIDEIDPRRAVAVADAVGEPGRQPEPVRT